MADTEDASDAAPWLPLEGLRGDETKYPARAVIGGETILIFKTATGLRGVERTCPHQQATLTTAALLGNGSMIRCAQHNYVFKLSDGKGINCPGFSLKIYEVKAEGGGYVGRRVPVQA